MFPASFPPQVCRSVTPFPPQGRVGRASPLRRYYEEPPTSPGPSPRRLAHACAIAVPRPDASSSLRRHGAPLTRGLVRGRRWTHPDVTQETRETLPGSWGTLVHACPALRPRWAKSALALSAVGPLLPSGFIHAVGPHDIRFRGSITRPTYALSTLRSGVTPSPRKTRFRLLARR